MINRLNIFGSFAFAALMAVAGGCLFSIGTFLGKCDAGLLSSVRKDIVAIYQNFDDWTATLDYYEVSFGGLPTINNGVPPWPSPALRAS